MTLNAAGTLLYVAEDESDTVDVIDLNPRDVGVPSQNQPATVNTVIETIPVIAPPSVFVGFAAGAVYRRQHQQRDAFSRTSSISTSPTAI